MDDDRAVALLRAVAADDGIALAKLARQLALNQSQLRRLISALGSDPVLPGLALLATRADGRRTRVVLTARGRALVRSAS